MSSKVAWSHLLTLSHPVILWFWEQVCQVWFTFFEIMFSALHCANLQQPLTFLQNDRTTKLNSLCHGGLPLRQVCGSGFTYSPNLKFMWIDFPLRRFSLCVFQTIIMLLPTHEQICNTEQRKKKNIMREASNEIFHSSIFHSTNTNKLDHTAINLFLL